VKVAAGKADNVDFAVAVVVVVVVIEVAAYEAEPALLEVESCPEEAPSFLKLYLAAAPVSA